MFRSYQSIIVAAFGWLIFGGASPPPKGGDQPEETAPSESINQAANSIATAIRESIGSPDKDVGCKQGHDERNSDLCAQWKAADAAKDAAQYALWGLLVGIAGTGLLFVTFRETRKVSRAQLRAYVSITPGSLKIVDGKNGKTITASLKIKNSGQTPAYEVVWSGNVVPLSTEQAPDFFSESNDAPSAIRDQRPTVIHNTDDIDGDLESVDPISGSEWDDILNQNKFLFLYGVGEYRDVFDKRRETQFCFMAEYESMRDGHIGMITGGAKQAPLVWQQAPFFNRAT